METVKRQQVRKCCDACSSQKIRCSAERPKCKRCAAKGLDCEYSVSRRPGRRPRSGLVGEADSDVAPQSQSNIVSPANNNGNPSPDSAHDSPEAFWPLHDDIGWTFTPNMNDSALGTELSFGSVAPQDLAAESTNPASVSGANTTTSAYVPLGVLELDQALLDNPDSFQWDVEPAPSAQTKPALTGKLSVPGPAAEHKHTSAFDCATALLKQLADFHVSSSGCLTAAKNPKSTLREREPVQQDVGAVVTRNQEGLKLLHNIMDCRCSLDPDVLIAMYLSLGRAIAWYSAMLAGDAGSGSEPSFNGQREGAHIADPLKSQPTYLGSLKLDETAMRVVRAHLVVTEIKENVTPLVERLAQRLASGRTDDSSASEGLADSALGSSSSLISLHHRHLVERVRKVTEKANCIKRG